MIGEKLQLERELAERERMAGLGQMAATIAKFLGLDYVAEHPVMPVITTMFKKWKVTEMKKVKK